MSILSSVIQRGTAASQPAATAVPVGTLYYQTDTFFLQRSNGATWDSFGPVLLVGDSGSGGTRGLAPAPAAGDAAAGKFLKADATWAVPSGSSGKVAQIVNTQTGAVATGTTVVPIDDTIPQNGEGDQYMSLSITPTSATNKLRIEVMAFLSPSVQAWIIMSLFQDTTANALATMAEFIDTGTAASIISLSHYMTAGTTSATTFKVRAGMDRAGTTTFNGGSGLRKWGGVLASSITITEYVP